MSIREPEKPEHTAAREAVRCFFLERNASAADGLRLELRDRPEFSTEIKTGARLIEELFAGDPSLDPEMWGWLFAADVNLGAERPDRARELLLRGYDRIGSHVAASTIADAYLCLGLIDASSGRWEPAVESWGQALKLLAPQSSRETQLRKLLGEGWETLGYADRCVQHWEEGLNVAAQRESIADECDFLCRLGRHLNDRDDLDGAAGYFLHAITRASEESFELGEAAARIGYGGVCLDTDEFDEAERSLHDGLAAARHVEDRFLQITALERLAELHERANDYDRARRALEEAIFLASGSGSTEARGGLQHRLGLLHDSFGKDALARTAYKRAIHERRTAGDFAGLGATYNNLGSLHQRRGEYDESREHYREALLAFNECSHDRDEIEIVLENLRRLDRSSERESETRSDAAYRTRPG